MINVIGVGLDGKKSLSQKALDIIGDTGLLIGGKRHLAEFPDSSARKIPVTGGLEDIALAIKGHLKESGGKGVAVLATGDPLMFGIADFILKEFGKKKVNIIPNVSTVQEAFARIKESSNGVKVLSVHGRGMGVDALLDDILKNEKAAVFTDKDNSPARIAKALIERGATGYTAFVCESLGTGDEKVTKGTLESVSLKRSFSPLNIMILLRKEGIRAGKPVLKGFGLADRLFSYSGGMITKEEIRVVSLSKLDVKKDSVVWDIGSGCGSVAVEAALLAKGGLVYAFEKNGMRAVDIRKNRRRFGAGNLEVIEGVAPGCLKKKGIARPDAVFIGGGGKGMPRILDHVAGRIKQGGRIVVNAVTMETAHIAFDFLKKQGWEKELVMVSVAKAKDLGGLNLLSACNPVFIITGRKPDA